MMYLYKASGATYLEQANVRYRQSPGADRWTVEVRNAAGKWEKSQ